MRVLLLSSMLILLAALPGCITSGDHGIVPGIQAEHRGYVPARIAILGCQPWPNGAHFDVQPLTALKDQDVVELCRTVDAFVVSGFDNQPFMKGYSPKKVQTFVDQTEQKDLLQRLPQLWIHTSGDCADCKNTASFYTASVATRQPWLLWLNTLAKVAKNSDAVLMPFITHAAERRFDDRGVAVLERSAGVALLLVDTNNGNLLWDGERDSAVSTKQLSASNVPQALTAPSWSEVSTRILAEPLWAEFPGRQSL